jgi:hypothetical protein
LLDARAADVIVEWFGGTAAPMLKLQVLDLAERLRSDEHGGSGQVREFT